MAEQPRHYAGQQQYPPQRQRPPETHCPPQGPPADQPNPPSGECQPITPPEPPVLAEPKPCEDPPCNCPTTPPSTPNCLEDLINEQSREITEAERAKLFKAELEALVKKAKTAKEEYTLDKYKELRDTWKKRDGEIVEVIRKLVCAVPCWWCLIECHICPLIYAIRYREQKLWGGGQLIAEVHSLYDLRYWHERNREARKAEFERIKAVLAAWEKPVTTIQAVLTETQKILQEANFIAPDATKLIYDMFLRVVPLHLAIAPPADSGYVTGIAKEYTDFCHCDEGYPDDCCGPDVGKPSIRARLIGPQPYLIHPDQYYDVICCLAKQRYLPAKDALAKADADFEAVDAEITRYTAEIDEKLKSLEKDAKAALPKQPIDCDSYEQHDDEEPPPQQNGKTGR
jgi:hypothetical protein